MAAVCKGEPIAWCVTFSTWFYCPRTHCKRSMVAVWCRFQIASSLRCCRRERKQARPWMGQGRAGLYSTAAHRPGWRDESSALEQGGFEHRQPLQLHSVVEHGITLHTCNTSCCSFCISYVLIYIGTPCFPWWTSTWWGGWLWMPPYLLDHFIAL